jgi:hypothetical protein
MERVKKFYQFKKEWLKTLQEYTQKHLSFTETRFQGLSNLLNDLYCGLDTDNNLIFSLDYTDFIDHEQEYKNFIKAFIYNIDDNLLSDNDIEFNYSQAVLYNDYSVYPIELGYTDNENYFSIEPENDAKMFDIEEFENDYNGLLKIVDKNRKIDIEVKYNDKIFSVIPCAGNEYDYVDIIDDIISCINNEYRLFNTEFEWVDSVHECIGTTESENNIEYESKNSYILQGTQCNIHLIVDVYLPVKDDVK